MSPKVIELQKKQKEIEDFFYIETASNEVDGPVLRKWIVEAIVHFVNVGVDPTIINIFFEGLRFNDDGSRVTHGAYSKSHFGGYKRKFLLVKPENNPYTTPIEIALKVSRLLVDKYEDSEKIIPKSLLALFNDEKNLPIKLAFEGIESNYQSGNAKGMASSVVTAIDLLTAGIDELTDIKSLKIRLEKLHQSKELFEKYEINREIIWALNTARIVRNYEVEHLDLASSGEVIMREAVGTAHILVLFANSLFASSKIGFKWDSGAKWG